MDKEELEGKAKKFQAQVELVGKKMGDTTATEIADFLLSELKVELNPTDKEKLSKKISENVSKKCEITFMMLSLMTMGL